VRTLAQGFCAITVVVAYLRLLNYLLPIENFGILVFSIIQWFKDFLKWFCIFMVIEVGFASGFHSLYSGTNSVYTTFLQANTYTFTGTFTGYDVADYSAEPLGFIISHVAFGMQIIYVITSIILLLNLLIALFSQTFDKVEPLGTFRHLILSNFIDSRTAMWPAPFNLLQITMTIIFLITKQFKKIKVDRDKFQYYYELMFYKKFKEGSITNVQNLCSSMVGDYFKEEMKKDEYINKEAMYPGYTYQKKNESIDERKDIRLFYHDIYFPRENKII